MYIVTANYNDRSSPLRWIARESSQDPKTVEPAAAVIATNVVFDLPDEGSHEARLGCVSVAYCETAEVVRGELAFAEPEAELQTLQYRWGCFYDPQNRVVASCDKIYLGADGSLRALNPSQKTRPRPETAAAA